MSDYEIYSRLLFSSTNNDGDSVAKRCLNFVAMALKYW